VFLIANNAPPPASPPTPPRPREGAPVAEVEGLELAELADRDCVSDAAAAVEGDVFELLQPLQRRSVELRAVLEAQSCRGGVPEPEVKEVKEVNRGFFCLSHFFLWIHFLSLPRRSAFPCGINDLFVASLLTIFFVTDPA